jgi:hypothetical protein
MEMVAGLEGGAAVAAFVRENLMGGGGLGALRSDCYPVDAVLRLHHELAGLVLAGRLEAGVAACLSDPEPFVRAQALVFFRVRRCPAGVLRVRELVAGDRQLFRGVPDPLQPGADLEQLLLEVASAG